MVQSGYNQMTNKTEANFDLTKTFKCKAGKNSTLAKEK